PIVTRNARKIYKNSKLRKESDRSDQPRKRWRNMLLVAFGQKKMFKNPLVAILHLFVYLGFVIINIEMLEIIIDGIAGTHRIFGFMGGVYSFLIFSFEILSVLVFLCCVGFLLMRNMVNV